MDTGFVPHEWKLAPEYMNRQLAVYPKAPEAGFEPDSLLLASTPIRASQEFFDCRELQYCLCRFTVSGARSVNDPSQGAETLGLVGTLPDIGYARGGTHQIAHACHQILVQNGVKFFTHAEAVKAIIEDGLATGVRLADGTVIGARKVVVSAGLSAAQLCFELLGRDIVGEKIARRVDHLSTSNVGNLMWYTFALHQAANYSASTFNPDINRTMWLGLAESPDLEHLANLYCTGGYWHIGSNASADGAYTCYKIMASDMGLGKPWEEKGTRRSPTPS